MQRYERYSSNKCLQHHCATIPDEMDWQIGRLMSAVAQIHSVVLLSDNGPTAWPRYYKEQPDPPSSSAGFRSRKWSRYEGGMRVPFMTRLPGASLRVVLTRALSSRHSTCSRLAARWRA